MKKLLCLSLLLLTGIHLSAEAAPAKGLLFHHSFSRSLSRPDFSANAETVIRGTEQSSLQNVKGRGSVLLTDNSRTISITGDGNFNPAEGTVSFWVRPVNWQMASSRFFQIFFEIRDSRQKYRFLIYKERGGNHLIASIAAGGESSRRVLCSTRWAQGSWHKIDFTWNAKEMRLYVDGVLPPGQPKATLALPKAPAYPAGLQFAPIWLNSIRNWIVNPEWQTMYDDLRIYSRVLSPEEISGAYGCRSEQPKKTVQTARPPFSKQDYLKRIWCQANPWFLPNHSPSDAASTGSPDHSWLAYSRDPVQMWKETAERCSRFGIDGLALEVVVRENSILGYGDIFKEMLDGFRLSGKDFYGLMFLTARKYRGDMPAIMARTFEKMLPVLRNHPNLYRLSGAPVIPVYMPYVFTPQEWEAIIRAVEKKCGRMIWLADIRDTYMRQNAPQGFTQWLRDYLQVFDGITLYANWPLSHQEKFSRDVVPMLKREFPEKIYETGPHNTFTPHTRYEGMRPRLTEKYIRSWEIALQSQPDAVTITNLFDIEEYSRILPSYEMDDLLMKISEYYIRKWRGLPQRAQISGDFYLASYTHLAIGDEAHFEVLGFPGPDPAEIWSVQLEICDERGSVLHRFPKQEIRLDDLRILKYALPTAPLAGQRGLYPRLRYSCGGIDKTADAFPPTILTGSLPPHLLTWGRSVAHILPLPPAYRNWSLDGMPPGSVLTYPTSGTASFKWHLNGPRFSSSERVRILRNFREAAVFQRQDLLKSIRISLPDPVGALDQYALELEDGQGRRYLSSSIWVAGSARRGDCTISLPLTDQKTGTFQIDGNRIPYFYYPCSRPVNLLEDRSGYDHHGMLSAARAPGSKNRMRGYRHEFCNGIPPYIRPDAPEFRRDADGQGYLHFEGARKTCAIINGGTAFPYSFTCEMQIRPDAFAGTQGLLGTPRGQYNLSLLPDGRIRAWRVLRSGGPKRISGEIISRNALPRRKWSHLALVYDLKKMSLYINGVLQGEAASDYDPMHQWLNSVIVGARCVGALTPVDFFTGDLRQIRLYGRSLAPDEFLQMKK